MAQEDTLLQEVYAHRELDEPRLVYADWLEEFGNSARADFIRAQCAIAKLPCWSQERFDLQLSADALFEQHRKKWTTGLKGTQVREYQFARGFLNHVVLNGNSSLQNAPKVFETFPTIRSVKINNLRKGFDEFVDAPWVENIENLNLIANGLGVKRTITLSQSKRLTKLEGLSIASNNIKSQGLSALLRSENMPRLKSLSVAGSKLGTVDDLPSIFSGPITAQIEWLDLEQLGLPGNIFDNLQQFLTRNRWPKLRTLACTQWDLYEEDGGGNAQHALSSWPQSDIVEQLEHLKLGVLTADDAKQLGTAKCKLKSLSYTGSPAFIEDWQDCSFWQSLQFLSLAEWTGKPPLNITLEPFKNLKCIHWPRNKSMTDSLQKAYQIAVIDEDLANDGGFCEEEDVIFGKGN